MEVTRQSGPVSEMPVLTGKNDKTSEQLELYRLLFIYLFIFFRMGSRIRKKT